MLHAAVHAKGVLDDDAAWAALDIADEADAATVLLEGRIVQALLWGQSEVPPPRQGSVVCSHGPILKPNCCAGRPADAGSTAKWAPACCAAVLPGSG